MNHKDEAFDKKLQTNISVFDKVTLDDGTKQKIVLTAKNSRSSPSIKGVKKGVRIYKKAAFRRALSTAACLLVALSVTLAFTMYTGIGINDESFSGIGNDRNESENLKSLADSSSPKSGGSYPEENESETGVKSCETLSECVEEAAGNEESELSDFSTTDGQNAFPDLKVDEAFSDTLRAVEVNDNKMFYCIGSMCSATNTKFNLNLNIYPENRVVVRVTSGGAPVGNVAVSGLDIYGNTVAEARTDINGDAYLYGGLFGDGSGRIVYANAAGINATVKNGQAHIITKSQPDAVIQAEIMLVFDASARTERELNYIKTHIKNIITGVAAKTGTKLKFPVYFCYDGGEIKSAAQIDIYNAESAPELFDGSGYGGEAETNLDTILTYSALKHKWNDSAVKICVLVVSDPSVTENGSMEDIRAAVEEAQKSGVRIIPVVAGGTGVLAGYLYRTLAAVTGGTTVFVAENFVSDGENNAEETLRPEKLDDLLIRVISSYLPPSGD